MKGLVKACEKRPISLDRLEALSLEIEKDLKMKAAKSIRRKSVKPL